MISIRQKGDFKKTTKFLDKARSLRMAEFLAPYGRKGVDLLSAATPRDTGKTAESWDYEITSSAESTTIVWKNSNVNKGVNIAILLQYGHGTRNGGYVVGRDYINPALQPLFDEIAQNAWREVTGS
jgi:hypothetical protein